MDKRRSIIAALLGGKSQNTVCRDLGCSKTTVSKAVKVIRDYAIDSEAIEHLTDADLDEMFSVRSSDMEPRESPYADPDFEEVCARLERNPKLTLLYLWEECASKCQGDKRPLSYSQYCRRFGKWQRSPQTASIMRYVAGQTAFVDWAISVFTDIAQSTSHLSPALCVMWRVRELARVKTLYPSQNLV